MYAFCFLSCVLASIIIICQLDFVKAFWNNSEIKHKDLCLLPFVESLPLYSFCFFSTFQGSKAVMYTHAHAHACMHTFRACYAKAFIEDKGDTSGVWQIRSTAFCVWTTHAQLLQNGLKDAQCVKYEWGILKLFDVFFSRYFCFVEWIHHMFALHENEWLWSVCLQILHVWPNDVFCICKGVVYIYLGAYVYSVYIYIYMYIYNWC